MSYPEVVVDVETMGVDAGSAPIAIGAVPFDREGEIYEASTHKVGIDFDDVLSHGCNIDGGTVGMWMEHGDLWLDLQEDAVSLRRALEEFNSWCEFYLQDEALFWSKGNEFDIGRILRPCYDIFDDLDFPWHRRRLRCLRTLELDEYTYPDTLHDPVSDGVAHAKDVIRYYND
jgi:hypothetical protein